VFLFRIGDCDVFIVKRNGKREKFNKQKIIDSLENANLSVSQDDKISKIVINNICEKIEKLAEEKDTMFTVDDVQDVIERYLVNINKYNLSKSFIKFRYMKELSRDRYGKMMDAVGKKLSCKDVVN
jgi:ribonucleoside-triphosphate reductase